MKFPKLIILVAVILIPLLLKGATALPTGTLLADGSIEITFNEGERGTCSFSGDFGSGTITVFYLIGDTYVSFRDSSGSVISYTDDNGFEFINPSEGSDGNGLDAIRITLSGATSPDIDYQVSRERN